nr:hypothetical protein Itr_chr14CG30790 [Ipomoea trifida]
MGYWYIFLTMLAISFTTVACTSFTSWKNGRKPGTEIEDQPRKAAAATMTMMTILQH